MRKSSYHATREEGPILQRQGWQGEFYLFIFDTNKGIPRKGFQQVKYVQPTSWPFLTSHPCENGSSTPPPKKGEIKKYKRPRHSQPLCPFHVSTSIDLCLLMLLPPLQSCYPKAMRKKVRRIALNNIFSSIIINNIVPTHALCTPVFLRNTLTYTVFVVMFFLLFFLVEKEIQGVAIVD